MKKIFLAIACLLMSVGIQAQTDTMYVMKAGQVIGKFNIYTQIDSIIFSRSNASVVTDIDGNVYNTIKIGTQTWMIQNLKTTKYNDGTEIPNVTVDSIWESLQTGAYCNYDNIESNATKYGRLYNWYAVSTGKLAPPGWRVPSDDDWSILINYLVAKGYNFDGTKNEDKTAKALASTSDWGTSQVQGSPGAYPQGNNSSGFTGLPGGSRLDGSFYSIEYNCYWWTSDKNDDVDRSAKSRALRYHTIYLQKIKLDLFDGCYIRCVKNE